jgi:hypothetical protein
MQAILVNCKEINKDNAFQILTRILTLRLQILT